MESRTTTSPAALSPRCRRSKRVSEFGSSRGFSLVELLVSIGVIGALLAIILPVLGSIRLEANESASLSNAKQHTAGIQSFADAHDDGFPFIEPGSSVKNSAGGAIRSSELWTTTRWWPSLLWDWSSGGLPEWYLSPRADRPTGGGANAWPTSYVLTKTIAADPSVWEPGPRLSEAEQRRFVRRTRVSEVTFASSKVLVFDAELAYRRGTVLQSVPHVELRTPMAFFDGHARIEFPKDGREPAVCRLDSPDAVAWVLLDTAGGIRGRDF